MGGNLLDFSVPSDNCKVKSNNIEEYRHPIRHFIFLFSSKNQSHKQMIASEKTSEFQVIIAIDFDDGRLFPLTENLPQCLLPIGNEKILRLQLNALEKFGATGKY